MELPGLTKALYGMTKEEALQKGVCLHCKQRATWYSPAGKTEYSISGVCEPCFDKITGESEMEIRCTSNNPKGSDVTNVLNNDHAQAAQKYLEDHGYSNEWQVVLADDKVLMLDYDDRPYDGTLPEQFYSTLGILEQMFGFIAQYFIASESKGGNTHAVVYLSVPLPVTERIAWQAAFGSDPKREALHLLSVSLGELNPILLFMRKDRQTTGVDSNGNSIVQCSHVDVATPQKLLAAGVPLTDEEIPY